MYAFTSLPRWQYLQNCSTESQPESWPWYSPETEQSMCTRMPPATPLWSHPLSFHLTCFLTSDDHNALPHLYNFVISEMLHQWNRIIYNLLQLAFPWEFSGDPSLLLPVSVVHSFLWLISVPRCGWATFGLTVDLLKAIWVVWSFWLSHIKLL